MTEISTHNGISSADVAAFYDDLLSYMKTYESGTNARLERVKIGLGQFIGPGMTVLDVGCGTGITSRHMAELGADVTAVDISAALVEFARSKSNGHKIEYLVKDAQDLDLGKTFDVIVMADVFEHILRDRVFYTMQRLLKYHADENTSVYLNMPNYSFLLFMRQHYADKLQIVDEAWKTDDVISLFANWGFWPLAMQMYGLDVISQYVEYLFIHRTALAETYKNRMQQIYGGNGNGRKTKTG